MSIKYIKPYSESAEYSKKYAKNFDKEKIEFKRAGKMVNLYDYIQEQNVDLDVYEVLEKGKDINANLPIAYGNMKKAMSLRNICDQKVAVNEVFENLPYEIRREFNNDLATFIERGEEFFMKRIPKPQETQVETPKEDTNVQK